MHRRLLAGLGVPAIPIQLASLALAQVVALVREVAPKIKAPLVLFTYFNPILKRGLKNYLRTIKEAGAAGLLVPDLPLEGTQTEGVQDAAREAGIELVLLATPTTPQARMETIARETRGFVYLVSVTGVTGVRKEASTRVEGLIKSLKEVTDKPVAVGFGVSGGEQAKTIAGWGADGVIVGSAFVKRLGESGSAEVSRPHARLAVRGGVFDNACARRAHRRVPDPRRRVWHRSPSWPRRSAGRCRRANERVVGVRIDVRAGVMFIGRECVTGPGVICTCGEMCCFNCWQGPRQRAWIARPRRASTPTGIHDAPANATGTQLTPGALEVTGAARPVAGRSTARATPPHAVPGCGLEELLGASSTTWLSRKPSLLTVDCTLPSPKGILARSIAISASVNSLFSELAALIHAPTIRNCKRGRGCHEGSRRASAKAAGARRGTHGANKPELQLLGPLPHQDGREVRGRGGEGPEPENHGLLDEGAARLAQGVADDVDGGLALGLGLLVQRDVRHLLAGVEERVLGALRGSKSRLVTVRARVDAMLLR